MCVCVCVRVCVCVANTDYKADIYCKLQVYNFVINFLELSTFK